MKTKSKVVASLFVLSFLLGFTACKDEIKYDPAEMPGNAQVFFPKTVPSVVEFSKDFTVTSYDVEVRRIDNTGALTVNLTVVNENPDLFTIPTSVSFAAGSDEAHFAITYDPNELGFDNFKPIKISIDQSLTSPYGKSVWEFTAGISAPWVSLGKAILIDAMMFEESYEVEIQQNEIDPTRYRLVDPYAEGLEEEGYDDYITGNQDPYFEFQILPMGAVYKGITTTVEGLVVYNNYPMGVLDPFNDLGFELSLLHPSDRATTAGYDNWMLNIVLQFSADGKPEIVQLAPWYFMADYNSGAGAGYDNTKYNGVLTIVFPGVDLVEYDYTAEIEYTGRLTDPAGDDYAVAEVTLGADVAYAQVAVVPGGYSFDSVIDIIVGAVESVEITASGTVRIPCTETDTYTYYVITYDADDEAQEYEYDVFDFYSSAGGGAEKTSIEDYYGDYIFTGKSIYDGDPDADFPVTISAGDEPNTLTIEGWKIEWIEDAYGLEYFTSVTATFDPETGFISIAPQQLEDFYIEPIDEWIEMFLYSYDYDGDVVSETDEMTFYRMMSGQLALTPSSEATGYIILDEDDDDWEGHYNVAFIPSASGKSVVKKSSVKKYPDSISEFKGIKGRGLGQAKASIVKKEQSSQKDNSISRKVPLRKALLKRNLNATSVF